MRKEVDLLVTIKSWRTDDVWYANQKGKNYQVTIDFGDQFYTNDMTRGFIWKEDCDIVNGKTNPNILAWKGTPGPWQVVMNMKSGFSIHSGARQIALVQALNPHTAYADAHMASAAPEAVEFIADLLNELQNYGFVAEPAKWLDRGEKITKKAYNF